MNGIPMISRTYIGQKITNFICQIAALKIFKCITLERQTFGKFMRNDNKSG